MPEKPQSLFFSEVFNILHVSANLSVSVFIPKVRMQGSLDSGPTNFGRKSLGFWINQLSPKVAWTLSCLRVSTGRPFHLTAVMSPGVARTHSLHI